MSNDTEWRIRALTAEHLLAHERAEIERLLDYIAELEEKLGDLEPEPVAMSGRFLVMSADAPAFADSVPQWVRRALEQLEDGQRLDRELEEDRARFEELMRGDQWSPPLEARSKCRKPKKMRKEPTKNRHHAQFTKEQWRK